MTIQEHLDALRAEHPECQVIAYADLSAGMVLLSSCRPPAPPRESLDALCKDAASALDGPMATLSSDTAAPGPCITFTQDLSQLRIYLRAGPDPNDALACICAPDTDPLPVIRAAQPRLDSFGLDSFGPDSFGTSASR